MPPIKSLGQNFLINKAVARRIVNSCQLKPADTVLEIGPGKGALTRLLSETCDKLIAIEKDKRLVAYLKSELEGLDVEIFQHDILTYPLDKLPDQLKIVGNLPYNIATPILEKLIAHRSHIQQIFMTVQLEYGQRIAANPNTSNYGSFSCFIQYYCQPKILFRIKCSSFNPVPKVQSCFMQLDIFDKPKFPVQNEKRLFKLIQACFSQRRKTIQNSLSGYLAKSNAMEILNQLGIDAKLRAENLTLKNFIDIANGSEKQD